MHLLPRQAQSGLLTVRIVVIVTIATLIGVAAGMLTYLTSHSLPHSLLAAGTATGGSNGLLNQIIGTASECPLNYQENNEHDDQVARMGLRETRSSNLPHDHET